jgi:hypothetical protein
MSIPPIAITSPQVSNYMAVQPLVAAVVNVSDSLPKTSLPTEIPGSVQSKTHNIKPVVLYNAHGILDMKNPNTLLAYA